MSPCLGKTAFLYRNKLLLKIKSQKLNTQNLPVNMDMYLMLLVGAETFTLLPQHLQRNVVLSAFLISTTISLKMPATFFTVKCIRVRRRTFFTQTMVIFLERGYDTTFNQFNLL